MTAYFEFLWAFLLLFALTYVFAHLPGIRFIKKRAKENLIFLISFGLLVLWRLVNGANSVEPSFIGAIGFIFLAFNGYMLLSDQISRMRTGWNVIIDFLVCSPTLFASAYIVASLDGLPIGEVIHQRFEDGSYLFRPGYLFEMTASSVGLSLLIIAFKYVYLYVLDQLEKAQRDRISKLESQTKSMEMRFDALQAKVNPHFLYNSLNSIAGLATVDGDKTRRMALALSRFFRYSINREQEMLITVEQEAEMIETYLEIEKIRFGDKLSYNIQIADDARLLKMPRMLLQPIVENSIKHGMKGNSTLLNVSVVFAISDSVLIISVEDNGAPYHDDFIVGYGIQSVYEKLDLLFPEQYRIELSRVEEKEFRIYLNQ